MQKTSTLISAGGPKFVVFVKIVFKACENVYLCILMCFTILQTKYKKYGSGDSAGGWPKLESLAAGFGLGEGWRIFFLSYASPHEGLERVVMKPFSFKSYNDFLFRILIQFF